MRFTATAIPGAYVLDIEPHADDRGFFARTWCARELAARGLVSRLAQCSVSSNARAGTLRGMHYQAAPHEETKVVQCIRGAIYDVLVDLRRDCATFRRWVAVELTAENRRMLYVPAGVAHGFQTLADDTDVLYLISEFYAPEASRGVRWNDPAFGIAWPETPARVMSDRDRGYADFTG